MRPAPFELLQPRSLNEALAAVADGARPLAGGQSLLQAMRLRDDTPDKIVDLQDVAELDGNIVVTADLLRIGARVTHRQLAGDERVDKIMPWLCAAAAQLGDVQVRNLGTVVGNICWADPRANHVVAMSASRAALVVADSAGESRIPLHEFFCGLRQHVLGDRLATALEVPRQADTRGVYLEFSRQRHDLALVNVCAVAEPDSLHMAVGGIDHTPLCLEAKSKAGLTEQLLDVAALPLTPIEDQHGSTEYKLHLARVLGQRALAALEHY